MNEPTTIREYIAARRKALAESISSNVENGYKSAASLNFERMYELNSLERWLDAHEPKAVGEETKVPSFEVQTCYGQFFVKDCKSGQVICMCTTNDAASRIAAAMLAEREKGRP